MLAIITQQQHDKYKEARIKTDLPGRPTLVPGCTAYSDIVSAVSACFAGMPYRQRGSGNPE